MPLPAPPVGDDDTTELNGHQVPVFLTSIRNTGPGSTAGMPAISLPAISLPAISLPAISLPAGATEAGLPIGISLEALPAEDADLLAVARQVEAVIAAG